MTKLWKHQQYAVDKYKDRDYFGLLFNMGLGKTKTAIAIAEEKEKPVLVIAPNAVCEQWKNEIEASKTKEWDVLVMTSKNKKAKDFQQKLDNLCKKE